MLHWLSKAVQSHVLPGDSKQDLQSEGGVREYVYLFL